MGKSTISKRSSSSDGTNKVEKEKPVEVEEPLKKHPVDQSGWLSFATFSWMNSFMYSNYQDGLKESDIPELSWMEKCRKNTDALEEIWTRERALSESPDLGRVLWIYCRRRVFLTTIVYLSSILLGFVGPTYLMKRVLKFASNSEAERLNGLLWIGLLILCEFCRVFLFTLTWAMSYRTALRIKTACMGLVYRKVFRLGNLSDSVASKLLNVISCDCGRLYEVVISAQVAIGGPVVLILSVGYILYELGWLSLIGMAVFPLAYPLQYLLAKGSGSLKRKAVTIKDARVSLVTQVIKNLRFIKMFGWEKYFHRLISVDREREIGYLRKSQLLQSFSVVLGPTLPHIGAIITFILYINSGNDLTPAQAFCITALFIGRIRPTLGRMRSGFRAYFDGKIAAERVQCFTILFVFSLLNYSIRAVNQLSELFYTTRIMRDRVENILTLPEIWDRTKENYGSNNASLAEAIILNEVRIVRRVALDNDKSSNEGKSKKTKKSDQLNSVENLLGTSETDNVSFQLENLNVAISKGTFVGICGLVGSGKTTFMEAVAGSIAPEKGTIHVMGKIAYVSQEPWIFKGTLRDNVIFGEPFEPVRYYNTISACCLVSDFGSFPLEDLTQTNEKGTNLSGGQKQRLSLARAIYSRTRDIYLLDDPFSGLDSRVAKTIYERVVKLQLREKTKTLILVTHQLQFLRDCDEILVFAEGTIAERGTHNQLMGINGSHYSALINSPNQINVEERHEEIMLEDSIILDCKPEQLFKTPNADKQEDSLSSKGKIPFKVYNLYIQNAGGFCALVLILIAFTLSIGSTAFSSWWLKRWFNAPGLPPLTTVFAENSLTKSNGTEDFSTSAEFLNDTNSNPSTNASAYVFEVINLSTPNFEFNRNFYAWIIGVIFITSLVRSLLFVSRTIKASKGLHKKMITNFFCNRIKSSDRIGSGQILNLFSRDMGEIDSSLPSTLETFLQNIFIVVSVFALVSIVFPVFLAPLFGLSMLFIWIRNVYKASVRDLKRIENDSKTPIFSRVTETVSGLGTIRAYGKEKMMMESFDGLVDKYHSIFYTFISSIRWLAIRLDFMAVGVTAVTALLILAFHGSVSAAAAGLALAYAAQLSGVFQFTVRLASETEAKFVSMERIHKFLTTCQTEDLDLDLAHVNKLFSPVANDVDNPKWPYGGNVKFNAVVLGYSSDNLPALRDVSFEVFAGQKVGIVGRTGSGKSSLGNALFRLNELKSGQIVIDGVDIGSISLGRLRESLCVIPQDPSIFQTTIRFNLDPGNLYTDEELWTVLEKAGLKQAVENLDSEVGLSQGQKQLLSIARALLRNSKVVFVDEATSNVDVETGAVVDRLLVEEFHSSTVFIVAHRLSALSYCDYILVMENGEVRDFGPVGVVTQKPEFVSNFEKFESVPL